MLVCPFVLRNQPFGHSLYTFTAALTQGFIVCVVLNRHTGLYLEAQTSVFPLPWQPPPRWAVQKAPLLQCPRSEIEMEVGLQNRGKTALDEYHLN